MQAGSSDFEAKFMLQTVHKMTQIVALLVQKISVKTHFNKILCTA